MARKRVVSRTFKATIAQVKAINVATEQFLTMEFTLTGTFKNEEAVLKAVKGEINNPDVKVLKVLNTWEKKMYAVVPEKQYMEIATITEIDPESEEEN